MSTTIYDKAGRERRRVKRCTKDRAVMQEQDGRLRCPECSRTVEVPR